MSDDSELAIRCENIVVEYPEPNVRTNTLKELAMRKIKGIHHVKKHTALGGVSISAGRGDCIALVGANGCGKSTLLKVMAGIIEPKSGTVAVRGRLAPLIELGAGFDPELTGVENVFLSCTLLGMTQQEIKDRLEEIKAFAELGDFIDAPVKTYSSGMYMRLGFACCTAIEPDVILIDEILAVGDENFQKKCAARMRELKASGTTIVLVSHDLNAVRALASRAIVLVKGQQVFAGSSDDAVAYYRELMEKQRLAALPEAERQNALRFARMRDNDARRANLAEELISNEPKAAITSVYLVGPGNQAKLESNRSAKLVIEFNLKKPDSKPVCVGFAIHTQNHHRILGGNIKGLSGNNEANASALCKAGHHKVSFDLKQLSLATGKYYIVAAIHTWALDCTLDYNPDAFRFDVVDAVDPNNFDNDMLSTSSVLNAIDIA